MSSSFLMQIAKRLGLFMSMSVEVTLDLDFSFPDSMSFVPVDLSQSHRVIGKTNECDAFEFTPSACAELVNQYRNLADRVTGRYCFDDFNATDDFKILRHVPLLHVRIRPDELIHILFQSCLRFAVDVDHVAGFEVVHRDFLAEFGLELHARERVAGGGE